MITLIVAIALEILAAVLVALWLARALARAKGDQRPASRTANKRTETGQGGAIDHWDGAEQRVANENSSPTKTRAGVIYSARNPTSRYARLMRGLLKGP